MSEWNIEKTSFDREYTFDEFSNSHEITVPTYSYFNCTLPRFNSMCQYSFDIYQPDDSSLNDIIFHIFRNHKDESTNWTCYIHLQCNLGLASLCINTRDGVIQCINGTDKEHY